MPTEPPSPADPFDLQRFIDAQAGCYADALAELVAGRKQSHWMWFVFPQLRGLGRSHHAHHYGISGLAEAAAYLAHPLLGARLRECVQVLLSHPGRTAVEILGPVDGLKLRSCLTLFMAAAPGEPLFAAALHEFFGGQPDSRSLELLGIDGPGGSAGDGWMVPEGGFEPPTY
jgi:uncharacterized protein (DUF1810 family)